MWSEKLLEDSEERGGIPDLFFSKTLLAAEWRRGYRRAGAEGCSAGDWCLVKVSKMVARVEKQKA